MHTARMHIFDALERDWTDVVQRASAQAALWRWRHEPALADAHCLTEILLRTRHGADPAQADAVLGALVRRAGDDPMAARTTLQALQPGMISLALRHGGRRHPDRASEIVSATIERIRSYPFERRPRAIAANVLLDVHQRMWRAAQRELPTIAIAPADWHWEPPRQEPEAVDEVIEVVTAARDRALITPEEAALILSPVLGISIDATDVLPRSIDKRRQRATQKLRRHVHLLQPA